MHSAVCSECGNSCEVPFKPTSSRPVFCVRCFKKDGSSSPSKRGSDRSFDRGSDRGPEKTMHRATCAECGNSCEVPFKPTGGKPVFCSNCFQKEKDGGSGSRNSNKSFSGNSGSSNFDNFFRSDKSSNVEKKSPDQFKEQIEKLNYKLDKILKLLSPAVQEVKKEEMPTAKAEKPVKVAKKVKAAKPKKEVKKRK